MSAPLLINLSNNVRVIDTDVTGQPQLADLVKLSKPLPSVLLAELDDAVAVTGLGVEEFLLAALGRAIARTFGVGVVKVNGLTAVHPIQICCASYREVSADHLLADIRRTLSVDPGAGQSPADIVFSYLALRPDPSFGPLQASDGAALGLLIYRTEDVLYIDWWYDGRRLNRVTTEELADQFFLGLIEVTSEVTPQRRVA
jgi:hypothetical protein